jgi:hypothetical protein
MLTQTDPQGDRVERLVTASHQSDVLKFNQWGQAVQHSIGLAASERERAARSQMEEILSKRPANRPELGRPF